MRLALPGQLGLSRVRLNFSSVILLLLCGSLLLFVSMEQRVWVVVAINFIILLSYVLLRPKDIFHPNNIVFAFSFLYVTLPSSIQLVYEIFDLPYLLPWGQPVDWFAYSTQTYTDIVLVFSVLFFGFRFFTKGVEGPATYTYVIRKGVLPCVVLPTLLILVLFVQMSGGLGAWMTSYKEAFLLGREGSGALNFIGLFSVNLAVFLLGLEFHQRRSGKALFFFAALLFILFAAMIQGIKSRVVVLLVLFFFPYLMGMRLKLSKVVYLGLMFFGLLFVGTYIRTDGFYDGFAVFMEYFMTYFNAYELHDMVVVKTSPDFLTTVHHVLAKPLIGLGLLDPDSDFDISVMLTKQYFASSWEDMRATQQWPLATELYYNYYGFALGWIPLLAYVYSISFLYKNTVKGNLGFALIFVMEFFRIFTVQRGVLIPWQFPVYLFFYILMYFVVNHAVRRVVSERS